ncbi:MAG: YbhN family protein [Deltaproteobacteria bacterium]|nr:YbhN family protein [Deltaproteobacteria bacterium]
MNESLVGSFERLTRILRRPPVAIGLSLMITVLALWLSLRNVDFAEAWRAIRSIHPLSMVAALGFMIVGTLLRTWRWHVFLRRSGSTYRASLEAVLVSIFFNGLLPMRSGEAMRIAYFARRTGAGVLATTTGLVLERVLDLITISTIGAVAVSLTLGDRFPGLPLPPAMLAVAAVCACVVTLAGGWTLSRHRDAVLGKSAEPGRVRRWLHDALGGLASLDSGASAAAVVALSFATWSVTTFPSVCVFYGAGIDVPLWAGFVIVLSIAFAIALPSSPGFIGTYHLGFIAGATLLGLPKDVSLAAAIVTHLLSQIPFIAAGGYVLATGGRSLLAKSQAR